MLQVFDIKSSHKEACFAKPAILSITIIFLTIFIQPASSQNYNFEVQTIPLKGEFINFSGLCFFQDRDGFMWFGSTEGLYRYHGNSTKIFRHDQEDENSLSNNHISDLHEDGEGVIWIATKDGLNRYDKYTESFKCYRHNEKDTTSLNKGDVLTIAEDKDQNLWIATRYGISLFDRETGTFKNYQIKVERTAGIIDLVQIHMMYSDNEDHLWLYSTRGVYRFDIPSGNFEKISKIGDNSVAKVLTDRSGRCWFSGTRGIYLYDIKEKTYKSLSIGSKNPNKPESQIILSMDEDAAGNIWIRTPHFIYCYDEGLELRYYLEYSDLAERSESLTKKLLVDNTGNIWFYSFKAIYQIIPKGRNFRIYDSDIPKQNWINCIYPENKDLIWYGTPLGIFSYDLNKNDCQVHYRDMQRKSVLPYRTFTMYPDRNGTIWIGTGSKGLFSMIQSGKGGRQLRRHSPESADSISLKNSLKNMGLYGIQYIFEDSMGRLWIGSRHHRFLHYYDTLDNTVFRLVDNPKAKYRLPERGVMRHQTGSDTLWVIGSSGIYKIILPLTKISDDKVMPADVIKCQLFDEKGQKTSIPSVNISYMDNSGNIWLGTSSRGLIRITGKRQPGMDAHAYKMRSYSISEGLPALKVLSIMPDDKGNLWMGTNNGLTKFNILSETFTNYFVRHGLPGNEFIERSAARGGDGELFFGTTAGMISFYPDSVSDNQHIAPVRITGIKVNNQSLQPGENIELDHSITYTDKIELHHDQNNISLEYAILNYNNPEFNQYRYKLEGFNDDWIYAGNRTYVDFTNLDPGKYTFMVSGSNNDGIWNEEGRKLGIIIHLPPWLTWYAWLVYGIILAGIILWYSRFLRNRAKLRLAVEMEKVEKEKIFEMDQMKSRFFANISHEFRTPLTLIRGPLEDLDKQETETISLRRDILGIMKRNTARLQNLINQLLDLSRMETGKVKLTVSESKLEPFVRAIILSFLSLAESKKIKYTYQLPGSDLTLWFDEDKLEKILVNLLSNAFKFTPEHGEIRIECEYIHKDGTEDPEYLSITIADTGIGIPSDRIERIFDRFYQVNGSARREAEGTGIGLALTKEMVELYRGEIRVESMEGKGTTFKLKLPVARDQFGEDELSARPEEKVEPVVEDQFQEVNGKSDIVKDNGLDKDKPLILIVEDNEDLRTYISGNLADHYRVNIAENGKKGFELAKDTIPDLVISDLMMPVMDGMEMCALLKADDLTSHIPVIMLTAKADRDSKLEGLKTGADDYLVKPFDAEELQVRIQNLIEQRNKLREKFRKEFMAPDRMEMSFKQKDQLINKVLELIEENYSDFEFSVDEMYAKLKMSRTQFFRKVNVLTGETPNEILRLYRMKKAAEMIRSGNSNIIGIMYEVGFRSTSHFANSFKKYFGQNPSEYRNNLN